MEKIKVPYVREDGFNPSSKCDNPIIKKWIHKDVVKKTGETEDDFIIEQKPVCVDEVNIQKSIDEEAKTTDLKYLLKQLLLTGDESIINKRPGFFGDITGVQEGLNGFGGFVSPEQIKTELPEELQKLTIEELSKMSDKEIVEYFKKVRGSSIKEETIDDKPIEEKKGE